MTLESEAFAAGASIPSEYTCEGRDISPPLRWSGVPAAARSLALIVTDPDAPDPAAPQTTFTHWILVDLPPTDGALPAGVTADRLPAGAREGTNDFGRVGYGGPCPPVGRHRYFHTLYALDTTLPSLRAPTRGALEQAMAGHVLARAERMGTYQKREAE
ncbi:YbhB/YbcL family Raf kinase inhibitor-like protein [Nannocystis bainbridge]|uniref:YbhB/YbcL family Raf kinase inhibitor-like protein n=1 Tax=Nannocystis bainbridge TaxID=2995303 RepID=A0ABT5E442_9BACT|nr:YbhB/YbcL family Raf kinase inhibitor-like protein [Nannocystis bainbridge]